MDFRTLKCTHNQRGMCIHCMVKRSKKQKVQNKIQEENSQTINKKCTHPAHMRCLKCLPSYKKESACQHPDYEQCKNCEHYIKYETFQQYIQQLANQCKHKKPCPRCLPHLARKTYSIDRSCRNHQPYPQAQCDACMSPTITIAKQTYSHVQKVRILTNSIYKICQTKCLGILLGMQTNQGVIQVHDIYFPDDQDEKSGYINPESLQKYRDLFLYFNLKQVGIIYSSPQLTSMALMISTVFQEAFSTIKDGYQISKFVTMRLQFSDEQHNFEPHFECFMVSDQFHAFHKNGLIFQKNANDANSFDLISAKHQQKLSQNPTFLRQGVETDVIFFKQIITWIPTVYDESIELGLSNQYSYPYFTIQKQTLDHLKILIDIDPRDPFQKYRNIQFLLHLTKLLGIKDTLIFLYDFYQDNPEIFLKQKLKICEKIQINKSQQLFGKITNKRYS